MIKIVTGCTDKTAVNYDAKATVQTDGACIYPPPVPPPGFNPDYQGPPCTATEPYGCRTEVRGGLAVVVTAYSPRPTAAPRDSRIVDQAEQSAAR